MTEQAERIERRVVMTPEVAGQRLDQALAGLWSDFSRSRLAGWIKSGEIRVDGRQVKPRHALVGHEVVSLSAELVPHAEIAAEEIELDILIDDPEFLVVNKPAGLVVHPGSGNADGTLVNALLHFDPALAPLPRAGLVHRLDKDTSGCLVVARTSGAHKYLVAALKKRSIKRRYQALVWGHMVAGGAVDQPLGRHPVDRRRQVVRHDGRRALTHYRVARRLAGGTLLDVELETGRTHQIRVHMAHIQHPIVGDPMYGRRGAPAGLNEAQRKAWREFSRQALHACAIAFEHPASGETVHASAPLPADMQALVDLLESSDGMAAS
ncbi:23S rRNA pseudouridine(1911/1915/1917) synthase RluD [Wenzhouxiangella sp. AB-CW3]|uniref:23S rRNA pseudouridine(1911/1915/1917) synthase RluD n=1 Tax=Wenzhouxiangella sp. AB-CW3 TaxID=2771012 RepID=UPI00168BF3AD|nr:23S rRNA pseudouridine(1911/1915/1917) synthase RluD [Wenzhouxiangella sp. AB-CW3]QOC22976.1 23S rRNA pseudouridine(1911/1915/1917) synthase RluD [Wenzhouxiangella sp. AB-CW3]